MAVSGDQAEATDPAITCPYRVLVQNGRCHLIDVVGIVIADVGADDAVAVRFRQAELQRLGVE